MKKTLALSLFVATIAFGMAPAVMASDATISVKSAFTFTRSMGEGAFGEDVRQLQILLNKDTSTRVAVSPRAGSAGRETTAFGPATTLAVKAFQKAHGIETTGIVGPLTRAALNTNLAVVVGVLPPSVTSFAADTTVAGTAILTVAYDGLGEKPTIWFAYGATPTSMTILSSEITSDKIVGSSKVTLSGLTSGNCYAQAFVKNSAGTTKSEAVRCTK